MVIYDGGNIKTWCGYNQVAHHTGKNENVWKKVEKFL
jgi:hypothetical protein